VPRAAEKAHGTEALSAESLWAALGTEPIWAARQPLEPALPRAWALALGTDYFFFSKLMVTLITYTSSQSVNIHHMQLIFIPGS
jgi:hypothetical protein